MLRVLVVLFFIFIRNMFTQTVDSVSGVWEDVKKESLQRVTLVFQKDGTLLFQPTLSADYNYIFKDNKIIYWFTNPNSDKFIKDSMNVIFKMDTIFRINNNDTSIMVRKTHNSCSGIEGIWKWKYPAGDTATYEFTPDKMLFRVPVNKSKYRYTIQENELTILFSDKEKKKYTCWYQNKVLIIKDFPDKGDNMFIKLNKN